MSAQTPFTLARRAERMNPSIIREILKITERPGIISLAGGLPSAETFPVEAMRDATARVLREMKCDLAQGFYFARPEPAETASRHVEKGGWLDVPV